MGILAGNRLFYGDFRALQHQLARRMTCLEVFASDSNLISQRDRQSLHSAWQTISRDWQDDDVIDNFELHSHFIELLQSTIVELGEHLEKPVSSLVGGAEQVSRLRPIEGQPIETDWPTEEIKQVELLHFAVREAPAMVEHVARIRGLATYAAAKGECNYQHDRKLRYTIACARAANEVVRRKAERLSLLLQEELPSLTLIKTYELKLMFLLSTVEMDILAGGTIAADSQQLFKLATEIIDVYLQVVDQAIVLLCRWHEDDLEVWLSNT